MYALFMLTNHIIEIIFAVLIRWKNNSTLKISAKGWHWKMFRIKPFIGTEGGVECGPAFSSTCPNWGSDFCRDDMNVCSHTHFPPLLLDALWTSISSDYVKVIYQSISRLQNAQKPTSNRFQIFYFNKNKG